MIQFDAEVIKIEVKKLVSLDKQYKIVIITENPKVLELEKYIADKAIHIEVTDG